MKKYELQVFDSRNTCRTTTILENLSKSREFAKYCSRKNGYPAILKNGDEWEQYEGNEMTEWSYPKGITK